MAVQDLSKQKENEHSEKIKSDNEQTLIDLKNTYLKEIKKINVTKSALTESLKTFYVRNLSGELEFFTYMLEKIVKDRKYNNQEVYAGLINEVEKFCKAARCLYQAAENTLNFYQVYLDDFNNFIEKHCNLVNNNNISDISLITNKLQETTDIAKKLNEFISDLKDLLLGKDNLFNKIKNRQKSKSKNKEMALSYVSAMMTDQLTPASAPEANTASQSSSTSIEVSDTEKSNRSLNLTEQVTEKGIDASILLRPASQINFSAGNNTAQIFGNYGVDVESYINNLFTLSKTCFPESKLAIFTMAVLRQLVRIGAVFETSSNTDIREIGKDFNNKLVHCYYAINPIFLTSFLKNCCNPNNLLITKRDELEKNGFYQNLKRILKSKDDLISDIQQYLEQIIDIVDFLKKHESIGNLSEKSIFLYAYEGNLIILGEIWARFLELVELKKNKHLNEFINSMNIIKNEVRNPVKHEANANLVDITELVKSFYNIAKNWNDIEYALKTLKSKILNAKLLTKSFKSSRLLTAAVKNQYQPKHYLSLLKYKLNDIGHLFDLVEVDVTKNQISDIKGKLNSFITNQQQTKSCVLPMLINEETIQHLRFYLLFPLNNVSNSKNIVILDETLGEHIFLTKAHETLQQEISDSYDFLYENIDSSFSKQDKYLKIILKTIQYVKDIQLDDIDIEKEIKEYRELLDKFYAEDQDIRFANSLTQ